MAHDILRVDLRDVVLQLPHLLLQEHQKLGVENPILNTATLGPILAHGRRTRTDAEFHGLRDIKRRMERERRHTSMVVEGPEGSIEGLGVIAGQLRLGSVLDDLLAMLQRLFPSEQDQPLVITSQGVALRVVPDVGERSLLLESLEVHLLENRAPRDPQESAIAHTGDRELLEATALLVSDVPLCRRVDAVADEVTNRVDADEHQGDRPVADPLVVLQPVHELGHLGVGQLVDLRVAAEGDMRTVRRAGLAVCILHAPVDDALADAGDGQRQAVEQSRAAPDHRQDDQGEKQVVQHCSIPVCPVSPEHSKLCTSVEVYKTHELAHSIR